MGSENDTKEERLVTAPRVASSLSADDLDHPEWNKVRPIKITRYWSGLQAPVGRHAEAQVCWSEEALSLRFVCSQNEPLIVNPNPVTDKKTIGLWERDVCEVFLAPDPSNPERYFEFEAAPTAEWLDLGILITANGKKTDWNFCSGMSAAASVRPQGVMIGMRIPWSEWIPQPEPGEEWRINLFRCVGPESEQRYLAWQPTETSVPNFHVPRAFCWLCFT